MSRGSAGDYQADERASVAGSVAEYQADERAGVARNQRAFRLFKLSQNTFSLPHFNTPTSKLFEFQFRKGEFAKREERVCIS